MFALVFWYFYRYMLYDASMFVLYCIVYLVACVPLEDWVLPLSAFFMGTTSKLASLFSTLSL